MPERMGAGQMERESNPAAPGHQPKPDVPGLWALTPTWLDVVCEEPASGSFHLSPDTVQRPRRVQGPRMKEVARHLQGQSSTSNSTSPYLGPSRLAQSRKKRSILRCRFCLPGAVWKVWEQKSSSLRPRLSKMGAALQASWTLLSFLAAQGTPLGDHVS